MIEGERFDDTPFGGYQGSSLPEAAAAPAPTPPQPLSIPPPDWANQEGDIDLYDRRDEPDRSGTVSAVDQMLADDSTWPEPVLEPLVYPPLVRPTFPEPDWRAEELARALAASGATQSELEAPSDPARPTYPAKANT